ncbi:MAG: Antifreeze glycoprotein H1C1A1 [Parcubacteria group bacterium GW2011_GWD2_38_11]|nr:MAG: Antifreeze glycoprotein H1C1A1 [Parcubacteria group bacterium GW2011_GWD2_38_11]
MALGRFMAEALGEGAFLGMLKHAWTWAGRIIGFLGVGEIAGKTVGEEIKKRLIDPKGWLDEHYFALDLAEAIATPAQKKMIEQAMIFVEQADDANGTTYAKNFRILVTIHDLDFPSTIGSPAVPGKSAVAATPAVPATSTTAAKPAIPGSPAVAAIPAVPACIRPGITILQELATTCTSSAEVFTRIIAVGAMQDASSSLENFLKFGKDTLWPLLKSRAIGIYDSVDCSLAKMETMVADRNEEFNNRPLWKKIFLN